MADFSRQQATAQRLISANGGAVTLRKFDDAPADASAPWEGPADPRAGGVTEVAATAVWVQPNSARKLGIGWVTDDLVKRSEQILIIAGSAGVDLSGFNEVDGPGGNFKIVDVERLAPDGATSLVWFLGVSR